MPAAPPAAETKKPATPPPAKTDDKSKNGDAKAAGGDTEKKAPAPSAGQEKKGAETEGKAAAPGGGDKSAANAGQERFDRMAVRAKLAVSEPGDAVEREADQIADQIRQMADERLRARVKEAIDYLRGTGEAGDGADDSRMPSSPD